MTTPINLEITADDIELSQMEFTENSSLPANATKKLYAQYAKYMEGHGAHYLSPGISLMNVFRRLIAYENYLHGNMELYEVRRKHNQLVTLEDTENFRTRAAEILLPYKMIKSLSISQKFAIAATQEQGLILVPNAPNITTALNVCYDLYDEDTDTLDTQTMITRINDLIAEFNFEPYEVVVKKNRYSPSTFSAQYRPFFRANNITSGEMAQTFIQTYAALGQYRTFWAQSKNSARYSGRVREFHTFMEKYTNKVVETPPYKTMNEILAFIREQPERSHIIYTMTKAWSTYTHMYYATLAQLDMDDLEATFLNFENKEDALGQFLHNVQGHMRKYDNEPDLFVLFGRDPISESRLKEMKKAEDKKKEEANAKKETPKVTDKDINIPEEPLDNTRAAVYDIFDQDQQPNFDSMPVLTPKPVQQAAEPVVQEEFSLDDEMTNSMKLRLDAANEQIVSLTQKYDKKKKEMQEIWIQIQEQEVLAKFFSSYVKK